MNKYLISTFALASVFGAQSTLAGNLPTVNTGADNSVPACVSTERLMAYLASRNPKVDQQRYGAIADHYKRFGQELGLRWDYAFFQMIVETGALAFGNDVKPSQNNFAGLGATGNRAPGESFPDVATGVKAHLQHLAMYAGQRVDKPVAERTRKVQEWEVLTPWHKTINRPIRFDEVTRRWATDPSYTNSVEAVGQKFFESFCDTSAPAVVQASAPAATVRAPVQTAAVQSAPIAQRDAPQRDPDIEKVSGLELARQAMERARAEGDSTRSGLGYTPIPDAVSAAPETRAEPLPYEFTAAEPEADAAPAEAPVPESRATPQRNSEARPAPRIVVASVRAVPAVVGSSTAIEDAPTQAAPAQAAPTPRPKPVVVAIPAAPAPVKPTPVVASVAAPPAKPVNPIDESVRTLISGKTFMLDAPMGAVIPIVFRENGTMRGSAGNLASFLGSASDEGRWWVQRGRLCHRWNTWLDRETQCLQLRQVGQTVHWQRDDGKSGTARFANR